MSNTRGEGRSESEKSQLYVDINYAKKKRKEASDLKRRYNNLCGPVIVTTMADDITMSHIPGMVDK